MDINQINSTSSSGLGAYRAAQTQNTGNTQQAGGEVESRATQAAETAPRTDRIDISSAARARLAETTEPVESTPPPPTPEPAPQPQDITTYNAAGEIAG